MYYSLLIRDTYVLMVICLADDEFSLSIMESMLRYIFLVYMTLLTTVGTFFQSVLQYSRFDVIYIFLYSKSQS